MFGGGANHPPRLAGVPNTPPPPLPPSPDVYLLPTELDEKCQNVTSLSPLETRVEGAGESFGFQEESRSNEEGQRFSAADLLFLRFAQCDRTGFRPTKARSTSCRQLDEKVAELHIPHLLQSSPSSLRYTHFSKGVKVECPFKDGHYRC